MRLLKLEVQKLLPYRAFWIFSGFYVVLFVLAVYILGTLVRSITLNHLQVQLQLFEFPQIWKRVGYIGSFFHYQLAFLVILSITNEFDFRTFRQQLMDGLSRRELLAGKAVLILLLSAGASLVLVLICLFMGLMFASNGQTATLFESSDWVIAFWLQSAALLSTAAVFGFTIRRPAPAIGAFLLYGLVGEPMFGWFLEPYIADASAYLPIHSFSQLIPSPFDSFMGKPVVEEPFNINFLVALGYVAILWLLTLVTLETRDF